MKLFDDVAIVGIGLIGGSMALSIKKQRLASRVIGVSRHSQTIIIAKRKGIIDQGSQDLNIIRDADILILATPVATILKLAPQIAGIIKPGCVVTDVGSTKKEIVSRLEKIFPSFVGGHPLAGSEKRGVLNIRSDLFKDTLCILTPTKCTCPDALKVVRKLWQGLGARTVCMSTSDHDNILSFVSHLPHAIAFSLAGSVTKKYLKFAYSGFRDTTRIASSDAKLWADIFLSNRQNMLKSISLFEHNLRRMKAAINSQDKNLLIRILKEAQRKRDTLK